MKRYYLKVNFLSRKQNLDMEKTGEVDGNLRNQEIPFEPFRLKMLPQHSNESED